MGINAAGNFEVSDNVGSTVVYSGTATTTPASVPSTPGNAISGFLIENTGTVSMQISMDGGTTFKTIQKRGTFSWNLKGDKKQLVVKTLATTTTYELVINFEDQ